MYTKIFNRILPQREKYPPVYSSFRNHDNTLIDYGNLDNMIQQAQQC